MSKRVVLAGGSGFIGRSLARVLAGRGYQIVVLTRGNPAVEGAIRSARWDARTLGAWAQYLEGAAALVNLTGKTVNCRHTGPNRREIIRSRVDSVHVLGSAIARCAEPPQVFIQASGIGFYGDARERLLDENAPPGHDFSAEVCRQWEGAFGALDLPATRKVTLRFGVVLGRDGGALRTLERLTRWFLGGPAGDGRQFISWIHMADLDRMLLEAIERRDLAGVFNATAPAPASNAEFMRELRRALHRPWSPPAPAPLVRIGAWLMGTEGELALLSYRCMPKRFLDRGFEFEYPELRRALGDLYGLDAG